MKTLTKVLFTAGITGLISGGVLVSRIFDFVTAPYFYALLPFGAIFLGLGGICKILERESALYDKEHDTAPPSSSSSGPAEHRDQHYGTLVRAH